MTRNQYIAEADAYLCEHRALLSQAEDDEYLQLLYDERNKPDTDENGNETPISLELAKAYKILQLRVYDASPAVNSFSVGGNVKWLSPEERANYLLTLQAAEEHGIEQVPFAGVILPIETALAALKAIDIYAMQCVGVTEAHTAAIRAKKKIETVDAYDFKQGYPEKLSF